MERIANPVLKYTPIQELNPFEILNFGGNLRNSHFKSMPLSLLYVTEAIQPPIGDFNSHFLYCLYRQFIAAIGLSNNVSGFLVFASF